MLRLRENENKKKKKKYGLYLNERRSVKN